MQESAEVQESPEMQESPVAQESLVALGSLVVQESPSSSTCSRSACFSSACSSLSFSGSFVLFQEGHSAMHHVSHNPALPLFSVSSPCLSLISATCVTRRGSSATPRGCFGSTLSGWFGFALAPFDDTVGRPCLVPGHSPFLNLQFLLFNGECPSRNRKKTVQKPKKDDSP